MAKGNKRGRTKLELDDVFDDLDILDKAIIRVKIEKPGITNTELAERFDVNDHKIGRRLKKDKVVKAIAELQKEAIDIFLDLQADAARYFGKVLRDESEKTINRLRAAREISKGVLSENLNVNMHSEDVEKKLQEIRMKYADSDRVE